MLENFIYIKYVPRKGICIVNLPGIRRKGTLHFFKKK